MIRRIAAAIATLTLLSACGSRVSGIEARDPNRGAFGEEPSGPPKEAKLELPRYPKDSDLVQFYPGALDSHRYFIDVGSLIVGADGVVRYALVMRTSGGAVNVSYEGIRCQTRERRLYAVGYPNKGWVEARRSEWEPIRSGRLNEHQAMLYSDYFCPDRIEPEDRASIIRRLRSGLRGESPHRGDR